MRTLILLIGLLNSTIVSAQKDCVKFLPYPNEIDMLMSLDDSISPIKTYRGELEASGYKLGEKVLDFRFNTHYKYGVDLVDNERPKLLIAGSYTCPVFRNRIGLIDSLNRQYRDKIDVYIVYVVEAHPNIDKCPYRDSIWITDQNVREGVLYPQPTTYQQRIDLANMMKTKLGIETTILVDNSNNDYWMHFGPAPNNAYLLDKNGFVVAKNTWVNHSIINSIDSFLAEAGAK